MMGMMPLMKASHHGHPIHHGDLRFRQYIHPRPDIKKEGRCRPSFSFKSGNGPGHSRIAHAMNTALLT